MYDVTASVAVLLAAMAVLYLVVPALALSRNARHRRIHLVSDDAGNESLVLNASIAGRSILFMLDTAYAGAPVVSESYAAVQERCVWGSVESRFQKCVKLATETVSHDMRHTSVDREFLQRMGCRAFTSGCTMRLMGIGETVENQADMLLCPPIVFDGTQGDTADSIRADVLVTNPLPSSPHILTIDYMLHRAPCVVLPRAGHIYFRLPVAKSALMRPTFQFMPVRSVGGAFCIRVEVGGAPMDLVIDTGASTTVSISSTSVQKLRLCTREMAPKSVVQVGVNGERVCSDIVSATVRMGRIHLEDVDILANSMPVQGSDGYIGMGVLRSLDMWFEHGRFGCRRSGLDVRHIRATTTSSCPSGTLPSACNTALGRTPTAS